MLQNSEMGYCTDDESDEESEELGTKRNTPQQLAVLLDAFDEHDHPMAVGSPQALDVLRQLRELFHRSHEKRMTQSIDREMAEMENGAS